MKKILNNCVFILFIFLFLVSCVNKGGIDGEKKIKIGVTSVPHGEMLNNIRNIFKLDFEIINYIDYELLNRDLIDGKIDGNFFQTREYLNEFNLVNGSNLVELTGVHIEPLIIYSNRYKSIDKISNESVIYIPNDNVNRDRALNLLDKAGLIKIDMDFNGKNYIVSENLKNLVINEVPVNTIPSFYKDADLVIMNTNIALENNIFPHLDGIFYEDSILDKDKINIFVTREDMKESEALNKISYFLNSYENTKFINDRYKGFIKPVY